MDSQLIFLCQVVMIPIPCIPLLVIRSSVPYDIIDLTDYEIQIISVDIHKHVKGIERSPFGFGSELWYQWHTEMIMFSRKTIHFRGLIILSHSHFTLNLCNQNRHAYLFRCSCEATSTALTGVHLGWREPVGEPSSPPSHESKQLYLGKV